MTKCKMCTEIAEPDSKLCFVCEMLAADSGDDYSLINDPFEDGALVSKGTN